MTTTETILRKQWLGMLSRAPEGRAAELLATADVAMAFDWLRQPEVGTVMVRGRAGGSGSAFNLGEITVTRCAMRLASGEVGHGYVQGRSKQAAEAAALVDALMQTDAAPVIQNAVLDPLQREEAARRQARAEKAAATKVEFFTMVRGED